MGDARAVLCREGRVHFHTKDHKPNNPGETKRICDAGGFVMQGRVCGSLAVARAFGDFSYKGYHETPEGLSMVLYSTRSSTSPTYHFFASQVSSHPDVEAIQRMATDEFLILVQHNLVQHNLVIIHAPNSSLQACDGVWDVITPDNLCKYIHELLVSSSNFAKICEKIIDHCLIKVSFPLSSCSNVALTIISSSSVLPTTALGLKRQHHGAADMLQCGQERLHR